MLLDAMTDGVARYARDVRSGEFPGPEHGYGMDATELEMFRARRRDILPVATDLATSQR